MTMPSRADLLPRRRVSGIGLASTILIGLVVVMNIVSTWATWRGYGLIRDFVAGDAGVTRADLDDIDSISRTVSWLFIIAFVATATVFIVWLWFARENAERLCPAPHRRSRGWVIGSWICPIVNLWFPFAIVDDVYRASRPGNEPDLMDLRSVASSPLLRLWWTSYLFAGVLSYAATRTWQNATSMDSLQTSAVMDTVATLALACAGVAIIQLVRRISAWQDGRAAQGNHA